MLVIGSRALRRAIPTARAARDWDIVGTPEERDALAERIEPLRGMTWTSGKAFFLYQERVLEFVVASPSSPWRRVVGLPGRDVQLPGLGRVRFASADTLLLLKTSHVHLPGHFWKTVEDVSFLRRHARLRALHLELLPEMRIVAEEYKGRRGADAGDPLRFLPPDFGIRADVGRWADPERPWRAKSLPRDPHDAESLLASLAHAYLDVETPTEISREREVQAHAIETLCTTSMGRALRIALAPHAAGARERLGETPTKNLMAACFR